MRSTCAIDIYSSTISPILLFIGYISIIFNYICPFLILIHKVIKLSAAIKLSSQTWVYNLVIYSETGVNII